VTFDNGVVVALNSQADAKLLANTTPGMYGVPNTVFNVGDKFSMFSSVASAGDDMHISVTGSDGVELTYNFNSASIDREKALSMTRSSYDKYGVLEQVGSLVTVPKGFSAVKIGDIARLDTKLSDIDKFWNSEGRLLLTDPQTITITQGDGKQAKITLYGYDTVQDYIDKLNKAIAEDLGQAVYVETRIGSSLTPPSGPPKLEARRQKAAGTPPGRWPERRSSGRS
jgi:hypothetical protein